MHASIEELLNLRDGEGGAESTAAHLAACAQCRTELEQLRHVCTALAALPVQEPAPGAWGEIMQRVAAAPPRSRALQFATGVAIAASLALVAVLVMRLKETASTAPATSIAATTTPTAPPAVATATATTDDTEALIERSRRLEAALAAVRDEPEVLNVRTATTIATLEDHIAVVDYRLSMDTEDPLPPEQSHRLWQQRVELMDSLVNVRYAQLQRVAY
jgi:hypothetical protein